MNKKIDLFFAVLMILSGLGHLIGTFSFYPMNSDIFVWSLSGVLAALLIATINILRVYRKDSTLAFICLVSSLCWAVIVILFGKVIGNLFDPRVLMHLAASGGLAILSFVDLKVRT